MLCIHNTQTDPYFNLAAEEYLLKNFKENIFMLWQNEPSIVIGKHQDVWAEVNLKFVQDQQIKIARRFSGGGAVYHDPGNLNLTFIETGQIMQTDKYTIQIMNFLKTLGVHVEVDERKGLTIGLFLSAGKLVRGIFAILIHSHRLQAFLHPFPYFLCGNPHVFRPEANILFHHLSDDLIIGILEHHSRRLADVPYIAFLRSDFSIHPNGA